MGILDHLFSPGFVYDEINDEFVRVPSKGEVGVPLDPRLVPGSVIEDKTGLTKAEYLQIQGLMSDGRVIPLNEGAGTAENTYIAPGYGTGLEYNAYPGDDEGLTTSGYDWLKYREGEITSYGKPQIDIGNMPLMPIAEGVGALLKSAPTLLPTILLIKRLVPDVNTLIKGFMGGIA